MRDEVDLWGFKDKDSSPVLEKLFRQLYERFSGYLLKQNVQARDLCAGLCEIIQPVIDSCIDPIILCTAYHKALVLLIFSQADKQFHSCSNQHLSASFIISQFYPYWRAPKNNSTIWLLIVGWPTLKRRNFNLSLLSLLWYLMWTYYGKKGLLANRLWEIVAKWNSQHIAFIFLSVTSLLIKRGITIMQMM